MTHQKQGNRQNWPKILRDELEIRRLRNPRYSLRALARDLDLYPSFLSEIISGKHLPSKNMGERIHMRLLTARRKNRE